MEKNLRKFIIKFAVFGFLLFITRAIFQVPVEYFRWSLFYEQTINRVFSKGDAIKVILLTGTLFTLYLREKISRIEHPKFNALHSLLLLIAAQVSVALVYVLRYITNYFSVTEGPNLYVIILLKAIALASAGFFLLFSVFQLDYAKILSRELKKEIAVASIFTIILYFAIMFVQSKWRIFSGIVADNLVRMLSISHSVKYMPASNGPILSVNDFTVSIGASCSGIDSMFLFLSLFGVIFALDYRIIKKIQFAVLFTLGIIGVFIVNHIRIYLLILVGVHISPKIAVGLFHTNAGWILFLVYFMGYYTLARKLIYKKQGTSHIIKK